MAPHIIFTLGQQAKIAPLYVLRMGDMPQPLQMWLEALEQLTIAVVFYNPCLILVTSLPPAHFPQA
jgi:hypothetical protein